VDWLEGRKEEGEKGLAMWRKLALENDSNPKVSEVAKAGLKAAEEQAAGKVSKAELLEFLQNKGVKVEEVWRSGDTVGEVSISTEITDWGPGDADSGQMRLNATASTWERGLGVVERYYDIHIDEDAGNVTVQGDGGRFIEVDAPINKQTLKDAERAIEADVSKDIKNKVPEEAYGPTLFNPDEGDLVLPGGENYGELVLTLPEDKAKTHETFELPSSHRFPESNILAHIRFTERVDADGKKMLFIEELQSDWSNEGRRDGWKQERPARVQKHIVKLRNEKSRIVQETGAFNHPKVEALDARIRNLEFEHPINSGGAPDMPFKGDNRYGALAMKRMIRWAADNGFDRLGWITGKDTAERYNLSKQVNTIRYFKRDDGTAELTVTDKEDRFVVDEQIKSEEEIEKFIGKEMASRLLSKEPEWSGVGEGKQRTYWLEGDDLKVGGVWAETLYDKVLPTQAKKIVKKKGDVGRTRLGNAKNNPLRAKKQKQLEYLEIDISNAGSSLRIEQRSEASLPPAERSNIRIDFLKEKEKSLKESRQILIKEIAELQKTPEYPEANYVDITPEVKALAEEGFSYFMPPGGGKGRAAAPAQPPASSLPATPIMPKVKLSDQEKEDSRRLLNLLKEKGI